MGQTEEAPGEGNRTGIQVEKYALERKSNWKGELDKKIRT